MKKKIVLVECRPFGVLDAAPLEMLVSDGLEVIDMRGAGIADPDFLAALARTDALVCGNDLTVDDDLLGRARCCRAIAKLGAGLDTVDIASATRHDAVVFHTPGANNESVADHTFALILALARKIVYCHQSLVDNRWEHTRIMGTEVWGKTLGLVGLGAIGRSVAMRAKGFEMRVVAADPFWPDPFARQHGIQRFDLDELLAVSDIVSIHSPLLPETRAIIDKRALALMKPTAFLINAARGGIVVENDLYDALIQGRIAGAGLDVFESEPPTDSALLTLPNVVASPHTAAFTHDAMRRMDVILANQVIDFFHKRAPQHMANPEVYERSVEGG